MQGLSRFQVYTLGLLQAQASPQEPTDEGCGLSTPVMQKQLSLLSRSAVVVFVLHAVTNSDAEQLGLRKPSSSVQGYSGIGIAETCLGPSPGCP